MARHAENIERHTTTRQYVEAQKLTGTDQSSRSRMVHEMEQKMEDKHMDTVKSNYLTSIV